MDKALEQLGCQVEDGGIGTLDSQYFLVRLEDGGNLLEVQAVEAMAGGITELDGVVFETPIVALQRDNVVDLL